MCGKNAKARKLADRRQARAAAYRSEVNPFEAGTRLWRYFIAARRSSSTACLTTPSHLVSKSFGYRR